MQRRDLGVVEARVRSLHTGSRWALRSFADMKAKGPHGEHLTALVAASVDRDSVVISPNIRLHLDRLRRAG